MTDWWIQQVIISRESPLSLPLPLLPAVSDEAVEVSLESLDLVLIPSCDLLSRSMFPAVLEEEESSLRSHCLELASFCRAWEGDDAGDDMAE